MGRAFAYSGSIPQNQGGTETAGVVLVYQVVSVEAPPVAAAAAAAVAAAAAYEVVVVNKAPPQHC